MEIASLNLAASAVPAASLQSSRYETVGFGKRAGARIIDLILHYGVGLTAAILATLLLMVSNAITGGSAELPPDGVASRLLSAFGFILFSAICEGLFGSTPGKYLLGLVVLREDGNRCSYTQALGRNFAMIIDGLFLGLVGYLSMKDSPADQRRGDKWADTVVATRASAPAGVLRGTGRFVGVLFLALFIDGLALTAAMLV